MTNCSYSHPNSRPEFTFGVFLPNNFVKKIETLQGSKQRPTTSTWLFLHSNLFFLVVTNKKMLSLHLSISLQFLGHASFAFCFPEMFHYMPLTRLQRIRCKGRGHIICVVTVCCWVACIGPHPPWGLISSVYQQRPMSPSGLPHSHTLQKGIGCSHIFASWEEKSALLLACCKTWALLGWMHVSIQNSFQLCCVQQTSPHLVSQMRTHIYSVSRKGKKSNKRTPRYYLFMFTNIYILRTHLQKYLDYILGRS